MTPSRLARRGAATAALAALLATAAASGAHAAPRYAIRGIYDRDDSPTGFDRQAALGFNVIDSSPSRDEMRVLAARGLKGLVWLGGYSNGNCRFNESGRWVRTHVRRVARSPAVAAYFIDDEPDTSRCPRAARQIRARSRLVKSLDRRRPTLVVSNRPSVVRSLARAVDVVGLDHYPCSRRSGCDYAEIPRQAQLADRLGVRYWGVVQAYGDDWFKVPTPQELHEEFVRWRATNMEGYLVFAWRYPRDQPDLWLANNPALLAQLAFENAS